MAEKEQELPGNSGEGAPAAPAAASSAPTGQSADSATVDSGAGGSGGEEAGASAASETPPSPPAAPKPATPAPLTPKPDWKEAKIRRLTAQLHELRGRENGAAETPPAEPVPAPSAEARLAEAEIDRRAQQRARELNAIDTFNRMCVEAATAGRQAFPDFDTKISALREAFAGGEGDLQQQVTYNQFIAAALETGQAPALLHQLGSDLDEAARIMALSPVKMAVELTKMAVKAPDTTATRAPKPITPLGSRGAAHTAIAPDDPERADNLPTPEWMKRRNEQEKQRFEARGRR